MCSKRHIHRGTAIISAGIFPKLSSRTTLKHYLALKHNRDNETIQKRSKSPRKIIMSYLHKHLILVLRFKSKERKIC